MAPCAGMYSPTRLKYLQAHQLMHACAATLHCGSHGPFRLRVDRGPVNCYQSRTHQHDQHHVSLWHWGFSIGVASLASPRRELQLGMQACMQATCCPIGFVTIHCNQCKHKEPDNPYPWTQVRVCAASHENMPFTLQYLSVQGSLQPVSTACWRPSRHSLGATNSKCSALQKPSSSQPSICTGATSGSCAC